MAYPFGNFPTLAKYIEWFRSIGGAAQSCGIMGAGPKQPATKLVSKNGSTVPVVMNSQEKLNGSHIGNLDRRLGVKSPWADLPCYEA